MDGLGVALFQETSISWWSNSFNGFIGSQRPASEYCPAPPVAASLGVEFLHLKEHKNIQSILFKHYHHHQIMVKSSPILEIRCWAETKSPETPHLLSAGHQPGPPREGSKEYSTGTPRFLWPLQQFRNETEHFCGMCSALEVESGIGPAGNHSFCEQVGARRCRFDDICNTLEFKPLIFDGWS